MECANFETSELEDVLRWSRVTVSFCSSWNNNCDTGLILIRFNMMRAAIHRIDIMIMENLNRIFNICNMPPYIISIIIDHLKSLKTCQSERSSDPRSSPYSLMPSSLPSCDVSLYFLADDVLHPDDHCHGPHHHIA